MPRLPLLLPNGGNLLTCVKEALGNPRMCHLRMAAAPWWAPELDVGPRNSKYPRARSPEEGHYGTVGPESPLASVSPSPTKTGQASLRPSLSPGSLRHSILCPLLAPRDLLGILR